MVFGAVILSSAKSLSYAFIRHNSSSDALRLLGSKKVLFYPSTVFERRSCEIKSCSSFRPLMYTKGNPINYSSPCHNNLTNLSVLSRLFHLSEPACKEISYEEFIQLKKKGLTVIDVRNQDEISQSGTISGSINIPMQHISKAFGEKGDYFKAKLGRKKPSENQMIMFLCKSGMRSKTAMDAAQKLGYKNSHSFRGGWEQFYKKSK